MQNFPAGRDSTTRGARTRAALKHRPHSRRKSPAMWPVVVSLGEKI